LGVADGIAYSRFLIADLLISDFGDLFGILGNKEVNII
jgi:hypothetical protein